MSKLIESLEGRRLLSTVTWDGGGANNNFMTPENWSNDQAPTSADDVVIGNGPGGTPTLNSGAVAYKSLTISRSLVYLASSIDLAGDLHVTSGGTAVFASGNITGNGKIIVDAGGDFHPSIGTLTASGNIRVPVDNYGTFSFTGGKEFGPAFHNYGIASALEYGDCYGVLFNEPNGIIQSAYVPISPGFVSLGLQRSTDGTVSPAPIVNRGTIYSGYRPGHTGGNGNIQPLTIYVDGSSTLGGTWQSTGDLAPLLMKSFGATSATTTFDGTFSFLGGELNLTNVNATIRGIADGSKLTTSTSSVTIAQQRTVLSVLNATKGTVTIASGGNRVLRTADLKLTGGGKLDVGDNLLIHGNENAPTALPAYQSSITGQLNGQSLTVEAGLDSTASTSRAVGFSNGAGLASFYPSHTFRGETFDNDDFVFFPTLRGDANFDRAVDFTDLVSLSQHYGTTTSRGFADGSFDSPASNSAVDFNDLVLLAQNYGASFAIAPAITLAPVTGKTAATKRRTDSAGELSL